MTRRALAQTMMLLSIVFASGCAAPGHLVPTTTIAQPTGLATSLAATATPVSTPSPTPAEDCHGLGRVESGTYTSALLDTEVPYLVYLPPCFAPELGPYPMIVGLHGKPFDETHWHDLGLDEAAEAGILGDEWPPLLLFMPRVPEPLFSDTDGGRGSYEQELLEGLLTAIELRYPIDGARRALAGISRGGVWALEIGLRHPETFDGVASLSPALAVNRARPEYDPLDLANGPGPFPNRVFLAAGESDWARAETENLARLLEATGVLTDLLVVPGGHESMVWEASLRPMLEAITADWGGPG